MKLGDIWCRGKPQYKIGISQVALLWTSYADVGREQGERGDDDGSEKRPDKRRSKNEVDGQYQALHQEVRLGEGDT